MSENKIFSNGRQIRQIKKMLKAEKNRTRWSYNLDISIILLE